MSIFPVDTNQLKKSYLRQAAILMREHQTFSKCAVRYALPKINLNNLIRNELRMAKKHLPTLEMRRLDH